MARFKTLVDGRLWTGTSASLAKTGGTLPDNVLCAAGAVAAGKNNSAAQVAAASFLKKLYLIESRFQLMAMHATLFLFSADHGWLTR
jgi:hypothetical protein